MCDWYVHPNQWGFSVSERTGSLFHKKFMCKEYMFDLRVKAEIRQAVKMCRGG